MSLSFTPSSSPAASPKERLRRMAAWMRLLIAIGAALLVLLPGWLWFAESSLLQQLARDLVPPSVQPQLTITPEVKRLAILSVSLGLAVGLYGLFQLWHLFGAYARGIVFGPAAITRLRKIGWAFLATAALRPATQTLVVLLLTLNNPPGQRHLVISLSSQDYLCLVIGGLLFAMAWAMVEATRIEQENASFV
jgi:hypothetical protein